ncbi:MAG TPA: LamG-like jellyroll fold domain-containing protein [Flavobacterium sp.]|jgi:hypothetical protein
MKQLTTFLLLLVTLSAAAQINNNLLAFYNFNGNVNDNTSNGFDATPYGVAFVADRFGIPASACYFNGIDNYVEFPNVDEMKTPLPVSFTFWVKYESTSYQKQVVLNTSFENDRSTGVWFNSTNTTGQYAINFGDGSYAYTPYTRQTFVSDAVIETSAWHHVAVVVNSATDMKIFIDKAPTGGYYSGDGGDLVYSLLPGCIGRHDRDLGAPADYFMGTIDDMGYWARALSPEEIEQVYDNNLSVANATYEPAYFAIYPNPATDRLRFVSGGELKTVEIFSTTGQNLYSGKYTETLDIDFLTSGVYFVKASGDKQTATRKVIVR